jgi:hypothetical protein
MLFLHTSTTISTFVHLWHHCYLKFKHNHNNGKWEYEIMYDSYDWLTLPWLVFIEADAEQLFGSCHCDSFLLKLTRYNSVWLMLPWPISEKMNSPVLAIFSAGLSWVSDHFILDQWAFTLVKLINAVNHKDVI